MLALVIDDSRAIRMLLSLALKEMGGPEVLEAESAEKAEAILKVCFNIDIILTDWHMPGMCGLELLTRLRSQPRFKTIPIFMTTSESSGENVVAALRAGATNYIIKPFDERQFREKVGPYIKSAASGSVSSGNLASISQSGTLTDGDLGNVIQFLMQSRKSGRCELECADCKGHIYFDTGRISGAQYKFLNGEAAFHACFCAKVSRYRFREETVNVPAECAITTGSTALLIDAAARRDRGVRTS